jgi:ABC-type glycerol-3-phosphate transport system permease component
MMAKETVSPGGRKKNARATQGVWMQRVLYAAFGLGLLATLLLLIAICTDFWVQVTYAHSEHRTDAERGGNFYKTGHYHGLWRICRQEYVNTSDVKPHDRLFCRTMYFFEQPVNVTFGVYDYEIMHYRRSSASISLIGLVLSIIAHAFTWYSMAQLRYMFKRLAATLHLIAAACCWVTVEVFKRSMDYEKEHLNMIVPAHSVVDFGFSYALTWVAMIFFILVCLAIFACSAKRKGRKAHSLREAQENEPVVLGRV